MSEQDSNGNPLKLKKTDDGKPIIGDQLARFAVNNLLRGRSWRIVGEKILVQGIPGEELKKYKTKQEEIKKDARKKIQDMRKKDNDSQWRLTAQPLTTINQINHNLQFTRLVVVEILETKN